MISDYLKSPGYYYKKHIGKTIKRKVTDPMKRGSVVDAMLTQDSNPYQIKVLKKDDPDLYEEQQEMDGHFLISETEWSKAQTVADHVRSQPIWSEGLEDANFQVLLEGEIEGLQVCGLADRINGLGDLRYRLIDLKVVNPIKIDHAQKWYWNVIEMGYARQMSLYQHLFAESQGIPSENVECAHIVGAFIEEGFAICKGFLLPQPLLDEAFSQCLEALRGIKHKQFNDPQITWADAETIGVKE